MIDARSKHSHALRVTGETHVDWQKRLMNFVDLPLRDDLPSLSDEAIVERIRTGDSRLFEIIMRRHNRRLFRAARAIVQNDDEAEDVLQDAYVRAYEHLAAFEGRARFATWLTRIAIHEALARTRKSGRYQQLDDQDEDSRVMIHRNPEQEVSDGELKVAIEKAVDALPEGFRQVFMLRVVEGLSVDETAECLELNEETVKTRLHRARVALQKQLLEQAEAVTHQAFGFHLRRCDRIVSAVLERIGMKHLGETQ